MSDAGILQVKISVPPVESGQMDRPALLSRLEEHLPGGRGTSQGLTLVAAPAGYGKTTLVRQWMAGREENCAWYGLDRDDDDPQRFWRYLVASLQKCRPQLGRATLDMLRSGGLEEGLSPMDLLTPVLNDLFLLENPMVVVLDDLHVIDDPQIHQGLVFVVENLPPGVRLVVTTRSEPPWPLARWRASGLMNEIRQGDLQLSMEETTRLIRDLRGIDLDDRQQEILQSRTEGWITGLHLAALSLRSAGDRDRFIQEFSATHRHLYHYLSQEVLDHQPEDIRRFLLETSVPERICPSLCDRLTGRSDSGQILDMLEQSQLFLSALDGHHRWYRYHPLFADFLRSLLKQTWPERPEALHREAAGWFLEAGMPVPALEHADRAGNLTLQARILETHLEDMVRREGPSAVLPSLERFPPELLPDHPLLAVHQAWFHLIRRGQEQARACLALVDLDAPAGRDPVLRGMMDVVQAYLYIYDRKYGEALVHARRAEDGLPADSHFWRSSMAVMRGDASLFAGRPRDAEPHYREACRQNRKAGNRYLGLSTGFKLATSLYFQARTSQARSLVDSLLTAAREDGLSAMSRTGLLWVLNSELLRCRGDLEEAEPAMERGLLLSEGEKPSLAWNLLFRTRLSQSAGDDDAALEALDEITGLHRDHGLPGFIVLREAALRAELLHRRQDSAGARKILAGVGIGPESDVRPGQEEGFLALAVLLSSGSSADRRRAREILECLSTQSAQGGFGILRLQVGLALTNLSLREGSSADGAGKLAALLELAEADGLIQLFRDAGPDVKKTLANLIDGQTPVLSPTARALAARILDRDVTVGTSAGPEKLPEELTDREQEILELLARGCTNPEISGMLYLSEGTVKWHTSNIYGKLGVRSRTAAVVRASQLDLIDPAPG